MADERIRFDFVFTSFEERKAPGALSRNYWIYQLQCRTNFKRYAQESFQTTHRYSDFTFLRDRLAEQYPSVIVPPLPPKDIASMMPGQSPSAELLEYRQRSLRKFLSRVGAHPTLQKSQELQQFLEKPETEWQHVMKAPYETPNIIAVMRKFPDPPEYGAKAAENLAVDARAWIECETYFDTLKRSFEALRSQQTALSVRRKESGHAIDLFGAAFQKIGDLESKTADNERQETPLSNAVLATGKHASEMATLYREQAEREQKQVAETMSYYLGMCDAAKETLKRVQEVHKKLDAAGRDVEKRRVDLEALRAKHDVKVGQAEAELRDREASLEELKRATRKLEVLVREECRQFHRDKQYDMKSMLKAFIDLQHDYAEKMKTGWSSLSPVIDGAKPQ